MTGAVVAIAVKQPLLALPAAFLSHFVIDMLPHWDYKLPKFPRARRLVIGLDLLISAWLLVLLAVILPESGWLAFFGGFLAIAPDAMWLPYILHGGQSPVHKNNLLHWTRRFHLKIQRSETSKGALVEAIWLVLMVLVLARIA